MIKDLFASRSHGFLIGVLILLSYFFLSFGNGAISLTHPDEVFYIQTAKEMLSRHSWLTPYIFDHPQFEKPILSFDMFALAVRVFGLTPFAGRFFPALFGMLGVIAVYAVSWLLFQNKRLSFFAGLILTTSVIHVAMSRAVLTDMIFSVMVLCAVASFVLCYYRQSFKGVGIIMFFVISAAAVLTKGILGILFPLLMVIAFLISQKDLKFIFNRYTLLGLFLFIIISLPWHLLMYQKYGQGFIQEYWHNVHLRRIFEAEHRRLDHGYFYPMVMFLGVFPWSFLLIPAFIHCFKEMSAKGAFSRSLTLIFLWIIVVFVPLEFAHSKLASYILPAFPALAIILAYYFVAILENPVDVRRTKWFTPANYLFSVFLLGLSIAGIIMGKKYIEFTGDMRIVFVFSILTALLSIAIFVLNRKKQYVKMLFAYPGMILILLFGALEVREKVEPWVSCKQISEILNKSDSSNSTVLTSKFYARGIRFYTDRPIAVLDINGQGFFSPHPIDFLNTDEMVVAFLKKQPRTLAIIRDRDIPDLERIIKGEPYRLSELSSVGGKFLVKIEKF